MCYFRVIVMFKPSRQVYVYLYLSRIPVELQHFQTCPVGSICLDLVGTGKQTRERLGKSGFWCQGLCWDNYYWVNESILKIVLEESVRSTEKDFSNLIHAVLVKQKGIHVGFARAEELF